MATRSSANSPDSKSSGPPSTSAATGKPPLLKDFVKEYARQRPEVVALWCFGIGFIIGWKLKP